MSRGEDNRVLVAQLTTDGVVSLTMNFQYDDLEGNSNNTDGLTHLIPRSGCRMHGRGGLQL